MRKKFWMVLMAIILLNAFVIADFARPTLAQTKPVKINILTSGTGSEGYTVGFALSEIVNRHLPGVKLTALESKSYQVNAQIYIAEPETRKNHIYEADSLVWSRARDGRDPFKSPAPGLKCVLCFIPSAVGSLGGYDPNISKPEDLKGKTIAVNVAGIYEWIPRELLNHWGIFDKVKYRKVGYRKSIEALMDGTADICFIGIAAQYASDDWLGHPFITELTAKKPLYFLDITEEDLKKMAVERGDAIVPRLIQKGTLTENTPNKDIYGVSFYISMWADKNMDEELVYKIVKTAIEHSKEFEGYAGPHYRQMISFMASAPLPGGKADWHPGAFRAYKEAGLKIGEKTR